MSLEQRFSYIVHLLLLLKFVKAIPTTLEGPFTPKTVEFDRNLRRGSNDLLPNDTRLERRRAPPYPEQVAVALSKPDAMWISWITGEYQLSEQVSPLNTTGVNSIVLYGTKKGVYDKTATGNVTVYSQIYPFQGIMNYSSGYIHHVLVQELRPSTMYFYKCGASLEKMSEEYTFATLPTPSPSSYPGRIAVVGDLGLTENSSTTIEHVLQSKPSLLLMLGDLCYADQYITNGTGSACFSCAFPDSPIRQTYQPHWDYWSRFMEPLTAFTPTMVIEGNHEIEPQEKGKTFESYKARFAVPSEESKSGSSLYYSFDAGGIHFIMLGAYANYTKTSPQYIWLESDLEKVDRKVTPWLVAAWHPPWYNSYSSHYREAECMRLSMEELLYRYKVDIVFNGHVHAYERMNRVYNNELDTCGPLYITVGDGGNIEKVDIEYADQTCPEPSPNSCPSNFTSGPAIGKFCWDRQPEWSALRDSSFGHGLLEVKNATHALWTWNRNQDVYGEHAKGDEIYIVRQPDVCLTSAVGQSAAEPALPPRDLPTAGTAQIAALSFLQFFVYILFSLRCL